MDTAPAEAFRRLHHGPAPLLLPNAWDVASALALAADGHPAIGTTSLGVAAAAGRADAAGATRAETVALAGALAGRGILLTVDVESGFSDDPDAVADLVVELADAGAVGVNIEDGRPDGTLAPVEVLAAKVAAVRARTPAVFVNARTDAFWLPGSTDRPLEEALRRAAVYLDAGADGIFVPGALTDAATRSLADGVAAPLNVLAGRHTVAELAGTGVRRISTGSLLYRTALSAAVASAAAIRDGREPDGPPPLGYAEVQGLAGPQAVGGR